MAKQSTDSHLECNEIIEDIKYKRFKQFYLLMGEEPYYVDLIVEALIDNVLEESEKDFNQTTLYANQTNTANIINLARRYPMFATRQLIIIKEAQNLNNLELLTTYLDSPSEETILVLAFTQKSVDKRTNFYKKAKTKALIFESFNIKEFEMPKWITRYIKEKGYNILPDAALLMAEHIGNSLRTVVLEVDKLIKGIDLEVKTITAKDIELNIGISREFNVFQLCKAISEKNSGQAFKIAYYLGSDSKKYPLVVLLGGMFYYFSKLLKANAYLQQQKCSLPTAISNAGVFKVQEYSLAMQNFKLKQSVKIISLIREYDYKSKTGSAGNVSDSGLLIELVSKILNV